MYRFCSITLLVFICNGFFVSAQDDVWSLQRCVQYAVEHNITIQQDVLNARLAHYTLLQSQLAQLPSLNGSASYNKSFGRSVNPITNLPINADYDFVGLSGNSNVLLFGWFQQRNTIAKNKFNLKASQSELDQIKDDVSLNVASGYLRAILAQQQIHASEKQVALSEAQLAQTRKFAEVGRLPELNVAQLESQLATDSSNLINALVTYNSAILDLRVLLNLEFNVPFEIVVPEVAVNDLVSVSSMLPEEIYQRAKMHFGSIRGSEQKVAAAKKGVAAAQGALYPQLNLSAQVGTNWASNLLKPVYGAQPDTVPVMQPYYAIVPNGTGGYTRFYTYQDYVAPQQIVRTPFGEQLSNNFRQTVSLSLNVPLFNGWQSQYGLRQARYNLQTQELSLYQAELTLKQNVYKAHNDALNAIQKYYASAHAEDAARRALDFAKKRYDLGLTSTVDFLVIQNQHYTAEYNLLSSKYDLIFKLKVIDYYLGKELKL